MRTDIKFITLHAASQLEHIIVKNEIEKHYLLPHM
jgi:hypothetical protein